MKINLIPSWLRISIGVSATLCILIIATANIVERSVLTPSTLLVPNDVHERIAKAVADGAQIEYVVGLFGGYVEKGPSFVLPNWPSSWLDVRKQGDVFRLGNMLLVSVVQPNLHYPFSPNNGVDMGPSGPWAGILVSSDGGFNLRPSSLAPWFEVRNEDPTVPHNVVGIFTAKKTLFVDVADSHGAGSGEGQVTRLSSKDGGNTWHAVGCFYYLPEAYHTMYNNRTIYGAPIRPHALAPTSSCEYRHP